MKSTLIAAALALSTCMIASASEINFSYSDNTAYKLWGAKVSQTYDVAISLPPSAFAGTKITEISVPVIVTDNISDYTLWLSKKLTLDTVDGVKQNVPDVMSATGTITMLDDNMGMLKYTLDTPYEITDAGIYVGYSFKVNKIDTDLDRYPIVATEPGAANALWLHTSKTYRTWADRSSLRDLSSTLAVTVEGDFAENSLNILPIEPFYLQADTEGEVTVSVINLGSSAVSSFDYMVTIGDITGTGTYTFETPMPNVYNCQASATINTPIVSNIGVFDATVTITGVNGQPNSYAATATTVANIMPFVARKLPLIEEFTGTWCGWCTRGWVAMETMAKRHSDFVGIAYHDKDPMTMPGGYPGNPSGFPTAWIDRSVWGDPFYGTSNSTPMYIEQNWLEAGRQLAAAEVAAETVYDDNTVTVNTTLTWSFTPAQGDYRLEYVLVGDGMQDINWVQSNYYAKYPVGTDDPLLDPFCKGGIYGYEDIPLLTFNDVALLSSGGKGVPESVVIGEPGTSTTHSYTFNLADSKIIDRAKQLRVVVMLLKANSGYGTVINCNKADITTPTGISDITAETVVAERWYDLSGRQIAAPRSGIAIKSVTYGDGTVKTVKVVK